MAQEEFGQIFARMREMLANYAPKLRVREDTPVDYYLETEFSEKWNKPLFFGSAAIKRNYVSYYLMPVYMYPELLDGAPAQLKKRMQGKSCFNFKRLDEPLLQELEALTRQGFEKFEAEGLVK